MADAEVGNLRVSLSMNSATFERSLASIDRSMRTLGQEMSIVRNRGREWGNTTDGLRTKQETLTRLLSNQEAKVRALRAAYESSKQATGENSAATERLAAQLNRAVAEYTRTETEISDVTAALRRQEEELRRSQSGWQRAGEAMQRVGQTMQNVGNKMKAVGQSMSLYVTAPIAAMVGGAVKAAIDFESAFAGVRKTVDTSEAGFKKLEKGIRDMAQTLPTSASDIAAVAESAGQLGIAEDNILGFTRTIIDLGESTNLTREQAATEFARFANIVGMSQNDFDKLGSSLVALGNNYATTESEISAMAMRLAGQGKQVKMSESDILALAATMSSLGIEAEAGGTAMSTVLKKMQTAVADNGKYLELYAKTAGVTGAEFKKAFETDAAGALDLFVKGLAKSSGEGKNLTEILSILGIKGIRESDTLLRMAGASDLLSGAVKTSSDAWKENTALSNEAEQRYKTTASQLAILKNKLVEVGMTFGEILIPIMMELVDKITPIIEGFSNLDEGTQKVILAVGGIAAAIGPVLIVGGLLVSSIGTIVTAMGTVSTAIAAAGGASAALGTAFAALTGPIGLTVLAIAGLGIGAVALVNHFRKPSLEAKVFGDNVSEGTQKAVGGFLELNDKATVSLNQLSWSGQTVTKDMATGIISTFEQMGSQVLSTMQSKHAEQLTATQDFFARSNTLTVGEEAKIVANVQKSQEEQQQKVTDGQNRVKEILTTAKNEKRAITEAERTEINKIQEEMKTTAVKVMSQSEAEQKAILASLKTEASKITAEQAAAVVKNSTEQKNKVVKDANAQYKESVAEIIRMRDESKVISADQADKLIKEAKRQKDETVKNAEETHKKVVSEAKSQADEHVKKVDWETGEIKSKWQVMKFDISTKMKSIGKSISDEWNNALKKTKSTVETIKDTARDKISDMAVSVGKKMVEVKSNIENGWNKAQAFLEKIDLIQVGKDVIAGFVKGITNKIEDVKNAAINIGKVFLGAMDKALDRHSPSKETEKRGKDTGQGFVNGITKKEKDIAAAGRKAAAAALKSFNTKMSNLSLKFKAEKIDITEYVKSLEAMKKQYANVPNAVAKINAQIVSLNKKHAKEVFDVAKSSIEDKVKMNEMSLTQELAAWEKLQKNYKKGSDERKQIDQSIYETKKQIHNQLTTLNDEYTAKVSDANARLAESEKALTAEYKKAVDDRTASLVSFAGIFDEVSQSSDITGQKLLENLQGQVAVFETWSKNIQLLAKKGIDKGLLEELRQMGPKAAPEIAALTTLTDQELTQYAKLWKDKNVLARTQAESELAQMNKDTNKKIKELTAETKKELDAYKKEWASKIKEIRTGTTDEFVTMKTSMKSIGKDTIKGLMAGMEDMEPSLQKKAQAIADSISKTIASALKIKSPSRVMMGLGKWIPAGLAEGMEQNMSAITNAAQKMANATMPNINPGGYASGFAGSSVSHVDNARSYQSSITIVNQVPNISPSELARKSIQAQRQLAMEWGV
ncbi:phage tail tape measure protein [Viridibacillus sp. FSL H7-0596]|uniref:phage tail tape measure protein n=1 Tax=Viridibacillus sp. FSL H7-0596 TaxID=1928923 RepID=UPI00096D5338|nr:phage tail tape measure protein [Viridibacillus sp. FSL H7-0596]OMC87467.1 phage tail tape measure protein [Viridibacillus sp. FSL H7-0596]